VFERHLEKYFCNHARRGYEDLAFGALGWCEIGNELGQVRRFSLGQDRDLDAALIPWTRVNWFIRCRRRRRWPLSEPLPNCRAISS
jgi:hypothetical protein